MFKEFEDRIKKLSPLFEKSVIRIMVDVRKECVYFCINTENFTIPEDEMETFIIRRNEAHDFTVFLAKKIPKGILCDIHSGWGVHVETPEFFNFIDEFKDEYFSRFKGQQLSGYGFTSCTVLKDISHRADLP